MPVFFCGAYLVKTQPWQLNRDAYDFQFPITPMYSHLDTERHVNNVAVHSFHVEARTRFLMTVLGEQSWFSDRVLLRPRRTVTHFIGETHYLSDVTCAARLVALEADSFRLALALFQNGECVGVQECLMGAWFERGWVDLPEDVTQALRPCLAADVELNDWPGRQDEAFQGLRDYPRQTSLTARYADLDPDRRLAELAVARYTEQSRAGSLNMLRLPGLGLLVVRIDIRYLRWDLGMGNVALASGLAGIGNTSFVLRGGVLVDDKPVADSESVMVLMDRASHRPTPVSDTLRANMAEIAI
jgi:acyl-CoA thioesterase FadM